jgi:hypothetical protein
MSKSSKQSRAKINRRMVLRGAAGFTLALPLLPSLLEKNADAATPWAKRFVAFGTNHGGIWQSQMYPNDGVLTQTADYAGRQVRRGNLPLDVSNGIASISPVLSGDSTVLTNTIAQKMNVLRGLDVTFYLAHNRGGHLGNYAENDGNGGDGGTVGGMPRPTIDQIMAWSDSFYPDLSGILERSLVIGNNGMSANWSQPSTKSGSIQNISPEDNSLVLFNKIFVPDADPTETRPPIVDRVIEDYRRLRDSNRRLSAEDRRRLNDHLDRLDELQRKLNVLISCGDIPTPTSSSVDERQNYSAYVIDPDAQRRFWQLHNDVIAAAFACETCRIASMLVGDHFSTYPGDWHQEVAHTANADAAQHAILADANQRFFEGAYLDLVSKLDAIDNANGGTVLDDSLVMWTQESGASTHDPIELPVVTAGSADGFFTTGNYCDYRDLSRPARVADQGNFVDTHIGLIYNQWLGNVLQSMGIPPSEYEDGQNGGYGVMQLSTETWYGGYNQYNSADIAAMSDFLPFIKA